MYLGISPEPEELKRLFTVVIQGLDETAPIPLPSSTDVLDVRSGSSLIAATGPTTR